MELNDVYRLWDRFDGSQAVELELDIQGAHLKLRKAENGSAGSYPGNVLSYGNAEDGTKQNGETRADGAVSSANSGNASQIIEGSELSMAPENNLKPGGDSSVEDGTASKGTPVKAPLVGTFYRAPSPDEEPFVKVGQAVKKGDTIGIIEAMKLMNEVPAACDGVILEIAAEDGDMVQYDQILVVIEPV